MLNNKIYQIQNYGDNTIEFMETNIENGVYAFLNYKDITNVEFEMVLDINEYFNDLSDLISHIKIYNCYNNECILTSGYIKYKIEDTYKIAKCEFDYCNIDLYGTKCGENSYAYYENDKFNICTIEKNPFFETKTLKDNEINFIFNKTDIASSLYNLYISDKNSTIIGLYNFGNL